MSKRKLIDSGLGDDARVERPNVKKLRKRLFRRADDRAPWTPPRERDMSELLEFILQHEEAFQTRARLTSLFSDFSQQLETNAESYYANLHVWKKAFTDAARGGVIISQGNTRDLLSIRTGEELARSLHYKEHGIPPCLSAVFGDALKKGEFVEYKHFLSSETTIYSRSWIPSVWDVARWGLKQLGVLHEPRFGERLGSGRLVIVKNVEAAADKVLQNMPPQISAVDRVISRADFTKRFSETLNEAYPLTADDFELLLVYLARDKQAISYDVATVKFKAENEPAPIPITQEDAAIVNLRDTLNKINEQIPPLAKRIAQADKEVREALKAKKTIQAKSALRSKKLVESILAQRTETAFQLEGVFNQLQQAADQVEIVAAMQAGAIALKGLHDKVGGAEGVQGVIDAVNEQMATTDEISSIINESNQPIDESEIDDEFEALERAESEKQEREEAAKTAARLAELEQAEKARKEKEAREEVTEKEIQEASVNLSQLSFHQPEEEADTDEDKERVPVVA